MKKCSDNSIQPLPDMASQDSLMCQFLKETGLNKDELKFRTTPGKDLMPRDSFLFYEKDGNIHIPYFTIEGHPCQFAKGNKLRDFERIRIKNPKPGQGKYMQPPKSGTFPYFTPGLIKKFKDQQIIKTLFITEGEKKALAGYKKLGLDIAAMGGIHSMKDAEGTNELHQDLQKLIKTCSVKHLVLLYDADAMISNYQEDNPEKDLYKRAYGFYKSISNFKELCTPLNCDLYFAHIFPTYIDNGKGLDELLLNQTVDHGNLRDELLSLSVGSKKHIACLNVSGNSTAKIKEFFGLDNAENFYQKHKSELKQYTFKYLSNDYRHNGKSLEMITPKTGRFDFWVPTTDKDGNTVGCKIDHYKLMQFIRHAGYRRFEMGQDYSFIRISDNMIEECSTTMIQDEVLAYIDGLNGSLSGSVRKEDLRAKFYNSPSSYFSKSKLSLIGTENLTINQDTIDCAYIYFGYNYVKVTKDSIDINPYKSLKAYVYKNQVQQRPFEPGSEECNFKQFVYNIAGRNDNRFRSLRSLLGYLLHSYSDYNIYAINLTDSRISSDDEGRTGKTLLIRAAGKLRSYTEIAGKTFDIGNKHRYQEANIHTQIIHLNDVRRNFQLECVFNDITDGVVIDKKNEQPYTIKPKLAITSNNTLQVHGASAKDRVIEFELADHYSDKFKPEDEFNEYFFRDWDRSDWNAFYNFMINCLQLFFKEGIIKPDSINLNERKLRQETHEDLIDFMDNKFNEDGFFDKEHDKKLLYANFLEEYQEHKSLKPLNSQRKFTEYLRKYATYRGYNYEENKSDRTRTICFKKKHPD